jgi:DNA-binding XRE family transcriptional regulator
MVAFMPKVTPALRGYRQKAGVRTGRMAAMLGISMSTLVNGETGNQPLSIEVLNSFVRIVNKIDPDLKCQVEDLIEAGPTTHPTGGAGTGPKKHTDRGVADRVSA